MKKLLLGYFIGIVMSVMGVLLVALIIIAAIAGNNAAILDRAENEDAEYDTLEYFRISGTNSGDDYKLKFTFDSWSVDDIELNMPGSKGTASATVKVPVLSGSRESIAYQYLRRKGFTPEGACGLLANLSVESANTFKSNIEEGVHYDYKGEDVMYQGYGICQWTNTAWGNSVSWRRRNVIKYLQSKGCAVDKDSDKAFLAELQYALDEYPKITKKMKECTDVEEATKIWCVEWERPANMYAQAVSRATRAKKYLDEFKDLSTHASSGTSMQNTTLTINYEIDGSNVSFTGRLDGMEIAGSFTVENGKVDGEGQYGEGASSYYSGGASGNPYGKTKFYITDLAVAYVPGHAAAMHYGWDLQCTSDYSAPIYAVMSGVVETSGSYGGYGANCVIVKSSVKGETIYTIYGHMSSKSVSVGDHVSIGTKVGTQGGYGASGPNSYPSHLHLEFRKGSNSQDNAFANRAAMISVFKKYALNYSTWRNRIMSKEIIRP